MASLMAGVCSDTGSFLAARNTSPVESCTAPKRFVSSSACVPLPTPGAPSRMKFQTLPAGVESSRDWSDIKGCFFGEAGRVCQQENPRGSSVKRSAGSCGPRLRSADLAFDQAEEVGVAVYRAELWITFLHVGRGAE